MVEPQKLASTECVSLVRLWEADVLRLELDAIQILHVLLEEPSIAIRSLVCSAVLPWCQMQKNVQAFATRRSGQPVKACTRAQVQPINIRHMED